MAVVVDYTLIYRTDFVIWLLMKRECEKIFRFAK